MARSFLERRGLSPVISTLIMINIVIAMFVILFSGFVPSITLSQSQANYWYGTKEDVTRERIAIEMIYFNQTTPKNISVYVRNVGEIDVKIISIYVNGTSQNKTAPSLDGGYPIYVKTENSTAVQRFNIELQNNWVSNQTYPVKVITFRGSFAISEARSP